MISKISGRVLSEKNGSIIIETEGLCYEVLIPLSVMESMGIGGRIDEHVELVTYHYYQMEPSRAIPMLIGFQNEVEKEFFEKFISVSGVGPKAACKALTRPFSAIAGAIDAGDVSFLKQLPGIGEQKARLIVAKLQNRVGKYGLIQDETLSVSKEQEDIKHEALEVLLQLQYKRSEADDMIKKALDRAPGVKTSEELLNEVYKGRKNG